MWQFLITYLRLNRINLLDSSKLIIVGTQSQNYNIIKTWRPIFDREKRYNDTTLELLQHAHLIGLFRSASMIM